ncbi:MULTISPECIES: hypothetical protein [Nocardia]|uniref:PASTA domain-containing protein n=1 Tax=Nocardia arthritidis TaxID=228602 RepID=A0A6G9YQN5_9NOCA|nr:MULTISPECIES: hypothetical protein [Nocardia]QIS15407.1 hypothetical protein F5544_37905 [Nocardia arthritidis]
MSFVRTTMFVGLAAAALTAVGSVSANAEDFDYAQIAKQTCAQAGLEYTESIYLPGDSPASATCYKPGQDGVQFIPLPSGTRCEVADMPHKVGQADGQGNCVTG